MKSIAFTLLIILNAGILFSQKTIRALNYSTLQPIGKIKVFSQNGVEILETDESSLFQIKQKTGVFLIYHPDYYAYSLNIENCKDGETTIYLNQKVNDLKEIVVSANKYQEKRSDIAQKIQVLNESQIKNSNQSSTADLIAASGNVFVQKSQLGGGSPIIRGFETNKVLMVVDGIRMNNAIYRGGHIQNIITLDNSIMERAEIIYGPGSTMYGSDAIGGVMHFVTKNPELSKTDNVLVKASGFARYFSAASGGSGHVDVSVANRKFGSLTSVTYSSFGNLKQGANRNPYVGSFGARNWYVERINDIDSMVMNPDSNVQVGSAYTQYDLLQKFTFKQSEHVTHKLNFQFSNSSNIDRYDRLTELSSEKPKYAQWYYGPQFRLLGAYTLELQKSNLFYDNLRLTVGYQSIEESRMDRKYRKNFLNHRIENLDIITLNADLLKRKGKHEIRYGVDAYYNKVNSTAFVEDIKVDTTGKLDTRYPDGGSSMYSFALYATHAWEINDKLVLNDGIRLTNVALNAKFNDKTFFPFPFDDIKQNNLALNGNLGLVYRPTTKWRFTVNASTAFRAPNVDDLTKVFGSVPGSVIVPNPNLKPEYSYNGELGITREIAEGLYMGCTAYYTFLKNALTVQKGTFNGSDSVMYDGEMSGVLTTTNAGKAYVYGIEGFVSGKLGDKFSVLATVNYTKGRIITDSVPYPLDHIPPVFGKFSLNYNLNKFNAEFFVNYSGWKRLEDYNMNGEDNFAFATPQGMPSWYTLNVRANYVFSKMISLQVACENILNQNYRNYASNISAPGRNFIITLRGNF